MFRILTHISPNESDLGSPVNITDWSTTISVKPQVDVPEGWIRKDILETKEFSMEDLLLSLIVKNIKPHLQRHLKRCTTCDENAFCLQVHITSALTRINFFELCRKNKNLDFDFTINWLKHCGNIKKIADCFSQHSKDHHVSNTTFKC